MKHPPEWKIRWKECCTVLHEVSPDTIIMVDAVSSLGGVKIEMDKLGIRFPAYLIAKMFCPAAWFHPWLEPLTGL